MLQNVSKCDHIHEAGHSHENDELKALDAKLSNQVYLSGEGFEHGDEDKAHFEKLKDTKIEASLFPNLARWIKFVGNKHYKQ